MKNGGPCRPGDHFPGGLAGFLLVSLLLHAALFSLPMAPLRGMSRPGLNPVVLLLGTPGAGQAAPSPKNSENPASRKKLENSPTHPRVSTPAPPGKEKFPRKHEARTSHPVRGTRKMPAVTKALERGKKKPPPLPRELKADEGRAEKRASGPSTHPESASSSVSPPPAKPEAEERPGTPVSPLTGAPDKSPGSSGVTAGKAPAAPATSGPGPVPATFGSGNGPRILHWVPPEYPRLARRLHKEGRVTLRLHIESDGQVSKVEVVTSAGYGFDRAAVAAVKRSRFQPASRNGIPVACLALLPVEFKLRQGEE
jgi:TonB family protein